MIVDPFEPPPPTKIIILIGPSGAGKTTIAKELMRQRPELSLVISCTTRDSRSNDLPGEYAHLTKEEFDKYADEKAFLWKTPSFRGKNYGTLKRSVDEAQRSVWPRIMILVPTTLPLLQAYTAGNIIPFFIYAPEDELRKRLVDRGDQPGSILKSMEQSRGWLDDARKQKIISFHFIENQTIFQTVSQVLEELKQSIP